MMMGMLMRVRLGGRGRSEIALRLGHESLPAAGAAEIVGLAAVLGLVLGGFWIDRHAADRVFHALAAAFAIACRMMMGMIMRVRLGGRGRSEIALGLGHESLPAAGAAEIVRLAAVLGPLLGGFRIDRKS